MNRLNLFGHICDSKYCWQDSKYLGFQGFRRWQNLKQFSYILSLIYCPQYILLIFLVWLPRYNWVNINRNKKAAGGPFIHYHMYHYISYTLHVIIGWISIVITGLLTDREKWYNTGIPLSSVLQIHITHCPNIVRVPVWRIFCGKRVHPYPFLRKNDQKRAKIWWGWVWRSL